ncbi:hypothetical protein [Accumulibacter sp.]|uniref:hypothetical protein n=1 Tax=Accumulibacter sp. TaxID=2053492 RepID=UPI00262621A5|nr:hypothetical protein [Accumulibacter sp.]
MTAHAYTEDQLVEQPAIGLFSAPMVLFESLPEQRFNYLFYRYFLFEWKTSE